jgi:hypothetical protein
MSFLHQQRDRAITYGTPVAADLNFVSLSIPAYLPIFLFILLLHYE